MVIDFDVLAKEIVNESIDQVKKMISSRIVVYSGLAIEKSLNLAIKKQINRFQSGVENNWANDKGNFIVPIGTRYLYSEKGITIFIVEQRPCFRTIFLSNEFAKKEMVEVDAHVVPFPYVYFMPVFINKNFKGMSIFYRNSPLTCMNQMLYYNNLPNFTGDGTNYCKGKAQGDMGLTYAQRIDSTINGFWNSYFNRDANSNWIKRNPLISIKKWKKLSLLEVLSVNWMSYHKVKDVILSLGIRQQNDFNNDFSIRVCRDVIPTIEESMIQNLQNIKMGDRQLNVLTRTIKQKLEQLETVKKKAVKKKAVKKKAVKKKL